jgi:outer membrane protein OmpA-like peptidoglycan-associated protein
MRRLCTTLAAGLLLGCGGSVPVPAETHEIAIATPPSSSAASSEGPTSEPRKWSGAESDAPAPPTPPALSRPIQFDTAKATLKPGNDEVLMPIKAFLEAHPEVTLLRIEGHSDNKGSRELNKKLTADRALTVARWFVARGIDCHRLVPVGFGDDRPIIDESEPPRRASRRIEFHDAAINGTPLGPVDDGGLLAGDPCS